MLFRSYRAFLTWFRWRQGVSLWSTAHKPPCFNQTQQNSNGYYVRLVATSMRSWRQRKASKTLHITYYNQQGIFNHVLLKHYQYPLTLITTLTIIGGTNINQTSDQ